jgi:hypothetical protein
LPDFSVEISGGVILDELRQGSFVKLCQDVLQLGRVCLAGSERGALDLPQR